MICSCRTAGPSPGPHMPPPLICSPDCEVGSHRREAIAEARAVNEHGALTAEMPDPAERRTHPDKAARAAWNELISDIIRKGEGGDTVEYKMR